VPQKILVTITKEYYIELREQKLRETSSLLRPYLREFINLLAGLDVEEVIDAIDSDTTIGMAIKKQQGLRLKLAAAKGALKYMNGWRKQVEGFATMKNAEFILRYENPKVYETIKQYGRLGRTWFEDCVDDVRKLILTEERKPGK